MNSDQEKTTISTPKRRVYFNEYNILMENTAYLPIVSGLLQSHAQTSDFLNAQYEFMPYFYHLDAPSRILDKYDNPDVAAFSLSMWNEQLNLYVAKEVKRLYPNCLIVFGGPQVPQHPQEYFKQYPFIDVAVRGEGEEAFSEILTRFTESRNFSDLAGVSWRDPDTGECIRNEQNRAHSRDLDVYPSPYVEGLFDDLVKSRPDMKFQAIIETNRGCPFPCTFCFWGQGGLSRKYRYHGIERIQKEFEWIAKNKILYVFNADSNFGMNPRDKQIAEMLVETKKQYGFPDKFRTCFGKNTDDKIFDIATLLHSVELEKGITLARQSNNEQVLENIRRQNIKLATYNELQIRFNESNVPVYSELILGLPGESMQTWTQGIEQMLQAGLKNQLFVYLCQVFPNTELADPEYQAKFGIKTKRIVLTEIHGRIRPDDLINEYEDIIITTDAMPLEEWKRMAVFSWEMMVLHSLKLGFFIMQYLNDRFGIGYTEFISYLSDLKMPEGICGLIRSEIAHFNSQTEALLEGNGRGRIMLEYGGIYWDEEEASFLRITANIDRFYDEIHQSIQSLLASNGLVWNEEELKQVIKYQRLRIPTSKDTASHSVQFSFNLPEYFERRLTNTPCTLEKKDQTMHIRRKEFEGALPRFARETILWGRKSGTIMTKVTWENASEALDEVSL